MQATDYLERSDITLKTRFVSIILLIILFAPKAFTQWRLEPSLHSLIVSGIDLILRQEYSQADSLFCDITNRYPNHPAGYLYQAAVMQAYAIDFTVPINRDKFESLLESGKKATQNLKSPWREYFFATADGYDAYERVERGDWFGGVRKGFSSVSKFEEIIGKDSSFFDAYVGIGTYYYWRSRKMEFLNWLPFVHDDRELGIQLLKKGVEHAEYNRFAAMSALVAIYLDKEEYKEMEEWSRRGLKSYPGNRIFLWGMATALDRQGKIREAVTAYKSLLNSILKYSAPHPYDEIVCRLNLSKCMLLIKDTTEVSHYLQVLLKYEDAKFPPHLKDRAQAKFTQARELLAKLQKEALTK